MFDFAVGLILCLNTFKKELGYAHYNLCNIMIMGLLWAFYFLDLWLKVADLHYILCLCYFYCQVQMVFVGLDSEAANYNWVLLQTYLGAGFCGFGQNFIQNQT